MEEIVQHAISFPFKETVDAILKAAEATGIKDGMTFSEFVEATYNLVYEATENRGFEKMEELLRTNKIEFTDDEYDVLLDAVSEELGNYKLEPYIGKEEYEKFR